MSKCVFPGSLYITVIFRNILYYCDFVFVFGSLPVLLTMSPPCAIVTTLL